MKRCTWLKPCLWAAIVALLVCGLPAWAQGQAAAPSAPAAAPAPPPLAVDAPLNVSGPSADDQAAGDPSGTKTGTANDVVHADPTKPLTLVDLVNQAGQNRIAINFVWTLVAGFLVMFMQAGFAIVETGLCRAKNANHTMMMNFMVYGVGMLAYWLIGFAIQMGGVGAVGQPGRHAAAQPRVHHSPVREATGACSGTKGFFLSGAHLRRRRHGDVPVPDGLHGHRADDRHRRGGRALEVRRRSCVSSFFLGAFTYPHVRQLGVGRRLARDARQPTSAWATAMPTSPAPASCTRSAASRRWRWPSSSARASASTTATASRTPSPATTSCMVLTGCFILAFGWFGFNPGTTLGASGALRIGSVAVNTMLAG